MIFLSLVDLYVASLTTFWRSGALAYRPLEASNRNKFTTFHVVDLNTMTSSTTITDFTSSAIFLRASSLYRPPSSYFNLTPKRLYFLRTSLRTRKSFATFVKVNPTRSYPFNMENHSLDDKRLRVERDVGRDQKWIYPRKWTVSMFRAISVIMWHLVTLEKRKLTKGRCWKAVNYSRVP
jgi:hypothetical protein